jgi:hypothetical protein
MCETIGFEILIYWCLTRLYMDLSLILSFVPLKVGQALRETIKQKNQLPHQSGTLPEPSSQRGTSTSSIDSSSMSTKSADKKPTGRQEPPIRRSRDQHQLLLRAIDEKNDRNEGLSESEGYLPERAGLSDNRKSISMMRRYRSDDSGKFERIPLDRVRDLDTKLPAAGQSTKRKGSDESSSLSDLIGTTSAMFPGYQDSLSVSSSIFSSDDQLDHKEHESESIKLGSTEFDLSGLRQHKQTQNVTAATSTAAANLQIQTSKKPPSSPPKDKSHGRKRQRKST